jgi:hypothetical protein
MLGKSVQYYKKEKDFSGIQTVLILLQQASCQ